MLLTPSWFILLLSLASWVYCDTNFLNRLKEQNSLINSDGEPCECVPFHRCQDGKPKPDQSNRDRPAQEKCQEYTEICCVNVTPARESKCGVRTTLPLELRPAVFSEEESEFGEFPWTVAILMRVDNSSLGVGSLIHPSAILTAAAPLHGLLERDVKVRAGEWDTTNENKRIPYQDSKAKTFIFHAEYDHSQGIYNIALIILESPFNLTQTVQPICLPTKEQFTDWDHDCFASGWGKDRYGLGSRYAFKMKRIHLNIVNLDACRYRLNQGLHVSFVCAEGRPGVNMCHGDIGAPLVCPTSVAGRYHQVGIFVSSGRCGEDLAPAVYTHVSKFRSWIDRSMKSANLDFGPYTLNYGEAETNSQL